MGLMNYLSNPVVTGILGAIGGVILTLVTKLGEGRINEIFENRKQRQAKKVKAAQDINSFCIEGMHKGFRIRANSEQHIKLRATEIEAIDEDVGIKLRSFLYSWAQCRNFLKRYPFNVKDEKTAIEYRNEAQKLGEELLGIAKKWGK